MPVLVSRCVNGENLIDHVIDGVSRGPASHVEFVDGNFTIGARPHGGVARRPIDNFPIEWRFGIQCTDVQMGKAQAFMAAQLGKPYNIPGIGLVLIDRAQPNREDEKSWFCSEFWIATLMAAEIVKPIDAAINLFTPTDALILSSAMFDRMAA